MWIWPPASLHHRLPESGRAGVPRLSLHRAIRRSPSDRVGALLWSCGPVGLAVLLLVFLPVSPAWTVDRPLEGRALLVKGWQALERGHFRESASLFEGAIIGHPTDALAWVGLALSAHRLQQDARALQSLTVAIRQDPTLTEARLLLARLYVELDRPDLAIGQFEAVLRQEPHRIQVRAELRQAQQAWQEDGRLNRISTDHVVVKFEGGEPAASQARQVAGHLEDAREDLRRLMGYAPASPVIAFLHAGEDPRAPDWAEGVFDGRIHVTWAQLSMPRERLHAYLRHEYAHAVIHRLSLGRTPTWLDEGLAQYLEQPAGSRPIAHREGLQQEPIFLESLHGDFAGHPRVEAERKYAESVRATSILIHRHGLAGLKRWLETLAVSKDLAQAYERVFDRPYPRVLTP